MRQVSINKATQLLAKLSGLSPSKCSAGEGGLGGTSTVHSAASCARLFICGSKAEGISRDVSGPPGDRLLCGCHYFMVACGRKTATAVQLTGCAYGLGSISSAQPQMDRSAVAPLLCVWRQPGSAAHHTYVRPVHMCRT